MLTGFCILILVAILAYIIAKHVVVRGIRHLITKLKFANHDIMSQHSVIRRIANIVPAIVIMNGIVTVPHLSAKMVSFVQMAAQAFIFLTIALAIGELLNIFNLVYQRNPKSRNKPIKGYLQLIKLIIFIVCGLMILGTFLKKDVFTLLAGFGAMAAVLMLIFQDTILSLVASVQISSNDVLRVGDWVEMPQLNADGDVIDIALHTVKIQNWDKTITTIPTRRFMTDPFKNWRGMQESGGRRIKRSLMLDQQSVHFLDAEQKKRLSRFKLLADYLLSRQAEIDDWNDKLAEAGKEPVNTRRITNIGTFRVYIERYLQSHPGIHQQMTLMVRQLSPTADGLPLELYCFTNTTAWLKYEGIQSDIFDHLLAILPEFGLRVYQHPSGMDVRALSNLVRPASE